MLLATVSALTVVAVVAVSQVRRPAEIVTVRVASGVSFFDDDELKRLLRAEGIAVQTTAFGSKELPPITGTTSEKYDAYVSASPTAVQRIAETHPQFAREKFSHSPLVVVTTEQALKALDGLAIVTRRHDSLLFDVEEYVNAVRNRIYWNGTDRRIPHGDPVMNSQLLLTTSDPRYSSSGEAFLSSASAAFNGNRVVEGADQVKSIAEIIRPCFTDQGALLRKTPDVLDKIMRADPVAMGLVYENDYLVAKRRGWLPAGTVALHLTPNVTADNTLIMLNESGRRLIQILKSAKVQRLLRERYGYRIAGATVSPAPITEYATALPLRREIVDEFLKHLALDAGGG